MKNNIVRGTIILTATTIVIRLIGFIFRIYLANVIGAEGMGLYQLLLSFYMLTVTFAISGISVAVSRLTAEQISKHNIQNAKKVLHNSIIICLITSGIATLILYFGAEKVSIYILKDTRAILPLKCLAPSLPFLAFSACYRGYFYAVRNVIKPSSAQLLEQIFRMVTTILLLNYINLKNIEYACCAATIGMTVGEVASFIYISFLYCLDKKYKTTSQNSDKMFGKILSISIPVAGTAYLNSALRLLENALIPIKLVVYGMTTSAAMSAYGMIKGMVLPILFFPTSFLTSLATMILPSISSANASKNDKMITKTVSKVLQFTLMIGILLVGIFMIFSSEISTVLYPKNTEVGLMIKLLSFICPFMYLNMVIISMLNGLGKQLSTFKINLLESIIKITFIICLVPIYGFNAYLLALFVTTILNTLLYMYKLLQITYIIFDISNWIIKPMVCAIIASIVSKFLYSLIYSNIFSIGLSLIMSIISIGVIYLLLLFITKSITNKDLNVVKNSI